MLSLSIAGCSLFPPREPLPQPDSIEYRWTDPDGNRRRQSFPHGPVVLLTRVRSLVEVYPPGLRWRTPVASGIDRHDVVVDGVEVSVATLTPSSFADPRDLGPEFAYPDPEGENASEETRSHREAYRVPRAFFLIEPDLLDRRVSPNFRLRDFLSPEAGGDLAAFWALLSYRIADKAEALAEGLADRGVQAGDVAFVIGWRNPLHNLEAGGALWSRHLYGDAVDLIVDRDRNGRMDDLDGDGALGPGDLKILGEAVGRLERRLLAPSGGCGLSLSGPHGAVLHIDARGHRVRWADAPELQQWWNETEW